MPAQRFPWIKFWPEAIEHEKFAMLSDSQRWTWVAVWAKASLQPKRWRFASVEHAAMVTGRPSKDIRKLIELRLIDETEDGIWMHNVRKWQEHYPSDDSAKPPPTPPEDAPNGRAKLREDSVNGTAICTETSLKNKKEKESKEIDVSTPNGVSPGPCGISPGDDRVDEVYQRFKGRIQPKSRLCPRKKIAARLKRFTVAELEDGIEHFAADPWWMEHNADKGAEWFFESDARSEQFLLLRPRPAPNVVPMSRAAPPTRPIGAPPEVPADSPFRKYVG